MGLRLISRILGGEIAAYHQSNLEGDRVIKFTKIETRQLFDLIQTVNESISVNEHLSGRFGHVEVVCEEALNGGEGFSVERFDRALLEYFIEEHFTKRGGKLIDQSADTEVFIADDGFIRIEYAANLKSSLRFSVGFGDILDIVNKAADTDGNLGVEFGSEIVNDLRCRCFDFSNVGSGFYLANEDDIAFTRADHVILIGIREHILNNIVGRIFRVGKEF